MKYIKGLGIAALAILGTCKVNAQGMAVNTSGAAANSSAILDVSSNTQGVLVPRMTSAQRTAISSPATGLLVYQTDGTAGFYFYNGTSWTSLSGGLPSGSAGGDLTGTYPNPSVANSAITSSKILDGTIVNSDISTSASIAYSKLNLALSVANSDIVDNAITSAKISNGTIVNSDISTSAAIAYSKLNLAGSVSATDINPGTATSGQVLGYNGTTVGWISPSSGSGTVTQVSSANGDISVATGTTTPVLTLNSGTGANQIVKLDGSGKLPAIDGSQLTNLPSGGGGSSSTGVEVIATLSAAQSIATNTTADVQFNTNAVTPSVGAFNTGTYSYTVGTTGNYSITVNFALTTTTTCFPMVSVNGAVTDWGMSVVNTTGSTYTARGMLSTVKKLTAGDVVKIVAQNSNTTTTATIVNGPSIFAITKL